MDKPFATLRNRIVLSLVLGLVVLAGLSLYADLPQIAASLRTFEWVLLPVVLLLSLFNYSLRFIKWHYYLGQIGVVGLPRSDSLMLFFSGLAMTVTPGKVGEWLKSYLLKEIRGTPLSASAPIIVAERLTDGVAMLLLASAGLVAFGYGWQILLVVLLTAVGVVLLSQHRPLARRLYVLAARLPLIARRLDSLRTFYESTHQLFKPVNLSLAVGLGLVSWFAECVAFFLVLVGLGLGGSPWLLLQATFILATATLVGSVSMLPGGLAAAEGSIAGLLLLLGVTGSPATAAAATLVIRFCTLWFGVSLGVVALALFVRRLARGGITPD